MSTRAGNDGMYKLATLSTGNFNMFVKLFKTLEKLFENIPLIWKKDGLYITHMDGTAIAIADCKICPDTANAIAGLEANGLRGDEDDIIADQSEKKKKRKFDDADAAAAAAAAENQSQKMEIEKYEYRGGNGVDKIVTVVDAKTISDFLTATQGREVVEISVLTHDSAGIDPGNVVIRGISPHEATRCVLTLCDIDSVSLLHDSQIEQFRAQEYEYKISLETKNFQNIIRSLFTATKSDSIKMMVESVRDDDTDEEKYQFTFKGEGQGTMEHTITSESITFTGALSKERESLLNRSNTNSSGKKVIASKSFSERYLKNLANFPSSNFVKLHLAVDDMPLRISYNVPDMAEISFYLAPKLSDEDLL